MSWQNRYLLPWACLDHDRIAVAVEHVMHSGKGLDLTRYKIDAREPDAVDVFFYFPAALERRWTLMPSDTEEKFRQHNIADTDEEFVHITFGHTPADTALDLPAETYFEFYSNISGNSVFSGVGIEVAERIGRYFGVPCEPL